MIKREKYIAPSLRLHAVTLSNIFVIIGILIRCVCNDIDFFEETVVVVENNFEDC